MERKEKRVEIKLSYSLYHRLVSEQIEEYHKTKRKPSIACLIRRALKKVYK